MEILKAATDLTVKDLEGKAGVWLWKLQPAPQQTASIHQAYVVQFSANRQLQETTGSGGQ